MVVVAVVVIVVIVVVVVCGGVDLPCLCRDLLMVVRYLGIGRH